MKAENQLREIERLLGHFEIFRGPLSQTDDGSYIEETVLDIVKEFIYNYDGTSFLCQEYVDFILKAGFTNDDLNKIKGRARKRTKEFYKKDK